MERKYNTIFKKAPAEGIGKGEIPYIVDNMFYECFGMSYDEVFEALRKSDFFELN